MLTSVMKFAKYLADKTVLITGANQGIGFQASLYLAKRGARIIMVDKNQGLSKSREKIIKDTGNTQIVAQFADFASLQSVRNLAERIYNEEKSLDVLINNVGVFCLGKNRTIDGLQATMQVNHFSPFLLTCLLSRKLKESAPSRIIFISSIGSFFNNLTLDNINNPEVSSIDALSSLLIYYNSKLCNLIISQEFSEKLSKFGITSNSLHPGMTNTEFLIKNRSPLSHYRKYFTQNVEIAAQAHVFLAESESLEKVSGKFFVDFREHQTPRAVDDKKFRQAIWDASKYFTRLTQDEFDDVIC